MECKRGDTFKIYLVLWNVQEKEHLKKNLVAFKFFFSNFPSLEVLFEEQQHKIKLPHEVIEDCDILKRKPLQICEEISGQ